MVSYDYLVVGAGLFGAVFAYRMRQRGKRCLVVDRRPNYGGNIRCKRMESINVHEYGAHIFHTSDPEVWDFMNGLVPFNNYINSPMACFNGKFYNLPFNMNTFYAMWGTSTPQEAQAVIAAQRKEAVTKMKADATEEPRNLEEQALCLVGRDIYERLIKGYTEKQWGRKCTELPAFIIRRLPVRFVYDNNYFADKWQGIPENGYNGLVEALLNGIDCRCNTDFLKTRAELSRLASNIVFTGQIDEYFDYCFGPLQYRSLRFEHQVVEMPNYQGNAVINYTEADVPFTRIIEHKHFECFGNAVYNNPRTVVTREYPEEWHPGKEPYYPVNDEHNSMLYKKYKALAEKEQHVFFGGRLAEYHYYDMAPIVRRALDLAASMPI